MMRRLYVLLALLFATLLAGESRGDFLLFQRSISVNRSVNIFDTNQFDLDLNFGNDFFAPTNSVTLFDSLVISPGDVGTTFEETLGGDPGFAAVAGRLTDALNEFIKVSLTEDQVGGLSEQRGWAENFFFGHVAPSTPPDLAGETVRRVTLSINAFTFLSGAPVGDSAALVAGQPFDLVFTLSIYNAVPEPATWLLLVGLIALRQTPFCRRQQAPRNPVV